MKKNVFLLSLCFFAVILFATTASAVQISSMLLEAGSWDGANFTNGPYPSGTPLDIYGNSGSASAFHYNRWDTTFQGAVPEPIWGMGVATSPFGTGAAGALVNNVTSDLPSLPLGSYYLYAQPDFTFMTTSQADFSKAEMTQNIINYNLMGNTQTPDGSYTPTMGYVRLTFGFDNGDSASAIFEVLGNVLMSDTTAWNQVWINSSQYDLTLNWGGIDQVNLVGPYESGIDYYHDLYFQASAQPVPIPGAIYLLGTGLLGLMGLRRRMTR